MIEDDPKGLNSEPSAKRNRLQSSTESDNDYQLKSRYINTENKTVDLAKCNPFKAKTAPPLMPRRFEPKQENPNEISNSISLPAAKSISKSSNNYNQKLHLTRWSQEAEINNFSGSSGKDVNNVSSFQQFGYSLHKGSAAKDVPQTELSFVNKDNFGVSKAMNSYQSSNYKISNIISSSPNYVQSKNGSLSSPIKSEVSTSLQNSKEGSFKRPNPPPPVVVKYSQTQQKMRGDNVPLLKPNIPPLKPNIPPFQRQMGMNLNSGVKQEANQISLSPVVNSSAPPFRGTANSSFDGLRPVRPTLRKQLAPFKAKSERQDSWSSDGWLSYGHQSETSCRRQIDGVYRQEADNYEQAFQNDYPNSAEMQYSQRNLGSSQQNDANFGSQTGSYGMPTDQLMQQSSTYNQRNYQYGQVNDQLYRKNDHFQQQNLQFEQETNAEFSGQKNSQPGLLYYQSVQHFDQQYNQFGSDQIVRKSEAFSLNNQSTSQSSADTAMRKQNSRCNSYADEFAQNPDVSNASHKSIESTSPGNMSNLKRGCDFETNLGEGLGIGIKLEPEFLD